MAIAETTFKVNKKQDAGLEPGLLRAFRLFNLTPDLSVLGLFLAPLFPNVATRIPAEVMPGGVTRGFVLYAVVSSLIQLLYFLWPHLPKRLGQLYFPIGIVLGTAIPLGRILFILAVNPEWFYRQLPSGLLQTYFLIPLIFIAWQYSFRTILIYSACLATVEIFIYTQFIIFQPNLLLLFQGSLIRIVSYLVIGYFITRLVASQRKQREELARANTQLLQYSHALEQLAESRERNRLARELHDTLAHYISGTILQLNGAKSVWSKDETKAKAIVSEAVQTLTEGLQETRNAIQTLRRGSVENLGLSESLRDLVTQYAQKLGLGLSLGLEPIPYLSNATGQGLYYIAQEILRNVERHAEAKNLSLTLKQQGQFLLLVLEDDGKGFEVDSVDKTKHFGLLGLEERVALLNGSVSVHSRPGQGTRTEIRVPLDEVSVLEKVSASKEVSVLKEVAVSKEIKA